MDFEKSASAKIRAAESAQKSAEAGLLNMENQVGIHFTIHVTKDLKK